MVVQTGLWWAASGISEPIDRSGWQPLREDTARGARSLNMAIWTRRDHWMNGDGLKGDGKQGVCSTQNQEQRDN